jgi:hypothetical protein
MSSASKASSKSSKTSKSDSDSEMEKQDKHSVFNGDIKKNTAVAKFFLKFINGITNDLLDKDSVDIILTYALGEPIESLEKLVKDNDSKTKKENKKKETVFEAVGLTKPSKAIDIFGKKFSLESKEKGIKFSKDNDYLSNKIAAWNALSDKEKEKYQKQSLKEKETFAIEYEKQKAEAIKNGLFREDEIKGPCTAYFQFLAEVRPKLNEKFSGKEVNTEASKMWKLLSDNDKEKYINAYKKEKAEYDIKKAKWNETEKLRVEKQSGNPVDIKIESSGSNKSTKSAKSAKSSTTKDVVSEAEDVEEVEEAEEEEEDIVPEIKISKKSESKKSESKKTDIKKTDSKKSEDKKSESKKSKDAVSDAEEAEEIVKVLKKPSSKKSKKDTSSDAEETEEPVKVTEVKAPKKSEGKKKPIKIASSDDDE